MSLGVVVLPPGLARLCHVSGFMVRLEEARELQGDDLLGKDPARGVLAEAPSVLT
jgi:hypothetical protein